MQPIAPISLFNQLSGHHVRLQWEDSFIYLMCFFFLKKKWSASDLSSCACQPVSSFYFQSLSEQAEVRMQLLCTALQILSALILVNCQPWCPLTKGNLPNLCLRLSLVILNGMFGSVSCEWVLRVQHFRCAVWCGLYRGLHLLEGSFRGG